MDVGIRLRLFRPADAISGVQNFEVVVGAGTLRSASADAVRFPHRRTPEGVTVEAVFTGAHLLHLSAAGCVLNDVYRKTAQLEVALAGVRVFAAGGFEADTWSSTGITYRVDLDTSADAAGVAKLLDQVDAVAEVPKALRAGAAVQRVTAQPIRPSSRAADACRR